MDYNNALLVTKNKRGWNFYEVNTKTLLPWLKASIFSKSDEGSARVKADSLNSEIKNVYGTGYTNIIFLDKIPCKRDLKKLL